MNQDEFPVQGEGLTCFCSLSLGGYLRSAPLGMAMPRCAKRIQNYPEPGFQEPLT